MKEQRRTTLRKLENSRKESLYLIIRGVEVGVVSALVCVLYRYLLNFAEDYLLKIIDIVKGSPVKVAVWIAALAVIGALQVFHSAEKARVFNSVQWVQKALHG